MRLQLSRALDVRQALLPDYCEGQNLPVIVGRGVAKQNILSAETVSNTHTYIIETT
jgi:hypothetical protein